MALNRGPAPVSGYETTPTPIGPLTSPPPQGGGVRSFVMPTAPRATTMNTATRFIEIDYNGNLVTTAVTSIDFTGIGVLVSNDGSAVTVNIPGGNGTPTGPNNSLQFNSNGSLAGDAGLTFNPDTSRLSVIGNVHANYFVGDATRLSNIPGANVVGFISYAESSNVANVAGTVTQAAQPNITSVSTSFTNLTFANAQTITGNNMTLTTGANTNAGTITGNWSLSSGSRLNATYADLAEYYSADLEYEPGTVVVFGGEAETTTTKIVNDTRLAGVVTTDPAYVMNEGLQGTRVCIALQGRVPCKVVGRVKKGDMLTTSATPGYAVKALNPTIGSIVGKALEDKDYGELGVIEVAVGRT